MALDNRSNPSIATLPADGAQRPAAPPTAPITPPALAASHGGGTRPPRVVVVDLSVARADVPLGVSGTAIKLQTSTNATDELQLKYDGIGDAVPFRVGTVISGVAFNSLALTNAATAAASVTLLIFNELPGLQLQIR